MTRMLVRFGLVGVAAMTVAGVIEFALVALLGIHGDAGILSGFIVGTVTAVVAQIWFSDWITA